MMRKVYFTKDGRRTHAVSVQTGALAQDAVEAILALLRMKDFGPADLGLFQTDGAEVLPTDVLQGNAPETPYLFKPVEDESVTIQLLEFVPEDDNYRSTEVTFSSQYGLTRFFDKEDAYLLPVDSTGRPMGIPRTREYESLSANSFYVLVKGKAFDQC